MKNHKIQKKYIDYGLGFPVHILNAPLVKIDGAWTLKLNFELFDRAVLIALAHSPTRLTGNQVRFIRLFFEMNLKDFGSRFGGVSHPAVIKWEKFGDSPTNMNWSCEKDIRLFIISKMIPKELPALYLKLEKMASSKFQAIKLNADELKAA